MIRKILGWLLALALTLCPAWQAVAEALSTDGVCLTAGQLQNQYGVLFSQTVTECFDFDGDGQLDNLFLDQAANYAYLYVQALPSGVEVEGGHDAMNYSSSFPFLYPWEQYYADSPFKNEATYDNPDWPPCEAMNGMGLSLEALSFLRAGDGQLYAAEASCLYGANGWPEMYVQLYQQKAAGSPMERFDVRLTDYLQSQRGDLFPEHAVNMFQCEYVADLGQWCFVLYQHCEDSSGSISTYARTCLTLDHGQIVVLARYMGDERVE